MLKTTMTWCATGLVALGCICQTATAQEAKALSLAEDTKLIAQIDVQAMQESGFGKQLIEMITDRVMEQIADRAGIDVPTPEDVEGFIGIDLMEETQSITIAASDFESPENGLLGIVSLKKNLGSLEAMLPSIPGYSSKTVGKHKIHSASPDGNMSIHLAVHTCGEGNKSLVVSGKEELVSQQLERMDSKIASDKKCIEFRPAPGVMLNVKVLEIPVDKLGDGPQTIIATMVKQLGVKLSEKDNMLNLALDLNAVDADNAEQLEQMIQGIVPMVEGQLGDTAPEIQVSREGTAVSLSAKIEAKAIAGLLEEQMDGAIGQIEGLLGN